MLCFLDNTGEALAGLLRPGNAGANTAADHITVLDQALAQIPDSHRHGTPILVRADSAGGAKAFLTHLRGLRQRGIQTTFSVGHAVTEQVRKAVRALPEQVWHPALEQDGSLRAGAEVAELTGLVDLSGHPDGTRMIVRRERPHPGAQLIADLQPYYGMLTRYQTQAQTPGMPAPKDRNAAILRLQQGAHAQALALGNDNATQLYRTLTGLVVGADPALDEFSKTGAGAQVLGPAADAVAMNIRRYARYVRLWLCHLIEHGVVPDEAVGNAPLLTNVASAVDWTPSVLPEGWWEDTNTDPGDPQFSRRP
ncbi:DDE family transposase [Streptomyces sp. TLI_235]|nr:DDE family transposase [Streptomyces sp. TLI_235]